MVIGLVKESFRYEAYCVVADDICFEINSATSNVLRLLLLVTLENEREFDLDLSFQQSCLNQRVINCLKEDSLYGEPLPIKESD